MQSAAALKEAVTTPGPSYVPNKKQPAANRLLNGTCHNSLLVGGSRSGKTFVTVRAIVNRALRAPGSRHAIWRKHFNHAKASIGLDTFPKVLRICFPDLYGKVTFNNEGIAVFPNGSEIWLAGLDDADRVEKVLGQEFATNFFNEISTMSWHAVETAQTRLAQRVMVTLDSNLEELPEDKRFTLPLKTFYDMNPAGRRHWSYQLFVLKVKPGTREPLPNPDDYAMLQMNPDDNRENLPPEYFNTLDAMSGAKRRRFKEGEWANDVEGALWTDSMLDRCRIEGPFTRAEFEAQVEPLSRVVTGVDPSGAGGPSRATMLKQEEIKNNDIGIVVCGLGMNTGLGYVLEDATINAGPDEWARHVADVHAKWNGDLVVAETNFGGAMVESTLRTANDTLPIKVTHSMVGKALRAEPVAALYGPTQEKVKHAGYFDELEEQMAAMMPQPIGYTGSNSPDRLDAAVFALTEIMLGSAYTLDNLD